MPLFVALAGNIGVGKSTAAHILAEALGYQLLMEPVLDNRFLAPYYADMRRWSFTLQMEFLLRRVEHHRQVELHRANWVQDRTLIEDPEVFAKYLHGLGHMTDAELDLYFDYCRTLMPTIRQPDRVVVLHCGDVNTLLKRINQRGRAAERSISVSFLRGLAHYYENFAQVCEQKYKLPTLTVDVSRLDVRTPDGRAAFLEALQPFLQDGASPSELPLG